MAVTIKAAELGVALRVGESAEELAQVTRLLAVGTAVVTRIAPDAPDAVQNEAVVRYAGFLFDQPNAGRGMAYASALRGSGAQSLLVPFLSHGVSLISDVDIEMAAAEADSNPVVGLAVTDGVIIVTYQDGMTAMLAPAAGVDQTAREAAVAAQASADRLPTATSADDTKHVGVDAKGDYTLVDAPAGGTTTSGAPTFTKIGESDDVNGAGSSFTFTSQTRVDFLRSWLNIDPAIQYPIYLIEITWSASGGGVGRNQVTFELRRRPETFETNTWYRWHFPNPNYRLNAAAVEPVELSVNRSTGSLILQGASNTFDSDATATIYGVTP